MPQPKEEDRSKEFTKDWVTKKSRLWKRVLSPFVGFPGVRGLEIGSYEGRSACWFLDNVLTGEGAVLHCVDVWQKSPQTPKPHKAEKRFRGNTAEYGERLVVHKCLSSEFAVKMLHQGSRELFDFIYLDSTHEASELISDLVLTWELLKPGGVLICDDYKLRQKDITHVHPSVAIDAFLACHQDWIDVHSGYQRVVAKKRKPNSGHLGIDALIENTPTDFVSSPIPRHKDFSIVVTCKGRLDHLKQTIHRQLAIGAGEYILVDYEDPDESGNWANAVFGDAVKVVKANAIRPPYFNLSHARNCGAKIAKGRYIAFMDADVSPCESWLDQIIQLIQSNASPVLVRCEARDGHWGKSGTCVVDIKAFQQIGGFREAMDRWGFEDYELYDRIGAMGKTAYFDVATLKVIEHPDDRRTAFYPERDKQQSQEQMRSKMEAWKVAPVNPLGWGRLAPLAQGVLTSADRTYFDGLKLLVKSIQESEPWPIACADLGLTLEQREWCHRNDVILIDRSVIPLSFLKTFKDLPRFYDPCRPEMVWAKPWIVRASPFEDTIWLDADVIVLQPLKELFEKLKSGPLMFGDGLNPKASLNAPALYEHLPVPRVTEQDLNSGVFAVSKEREAPLLNAWIECVQHAGSNKNIRDAIRWHDQGAMLWALHKTGCIDCVDSWKRWNVPANYATSKHLKERKSYRRASLLQDLKADHPNAGIVHYMAQPKLWDLLEPDLGITIVTSIVDNDDGLLEHFLNYYMGLGVQDFLFVNYTGQKIGIGKEFMAQGPFDVHSDAALRTKLVRNHLPPNSWFILADLDEFHDEEWVRNWKTLVASEVDFVASEISDRFAGADLSLSPLSPLEHDRSIFEQYPFACRFTRDIAQGENSKIMLMRNDGQPITPGHHATGHRGRPHVAVGTTHHFKWRLGVMDRLKRRHGYYSSKGYHFAAESKRVLDFFSAKQSGRSGHPSEKARAVVIHAGGTGSSMLVSPLIEHPIPSVWLEELNNVDVTPSYADISDFPKAQYNFFEQCGWDGSRQLCGMTIRIDKPRSGQAAAAVNCAQGARIILLSRENLLARYVSEQIGKMTETDPFSSLGSATTLPAISVSPDDLRQDFIYIEESYQRVLQELTNSQVLPVTYEELSESEAEHHWRRITDFLGLAPVPWSPSFCKHETRPLKELISNFNELAEAFAGTRWAWMFESNASTKVVAAE